MNRFISVQDRIKMCTCCFGNVEGESCGWPKGTVRATVALVTIPLGFAAATAVVGVLMWKEQYTAATGIIGTIFGIVGTIIGHYFGSKQAEGAAQLISQTEHELIESRNQEIAHGERGFRRGMFDHREFSDPRVIDPRTGDPAEPSEVEVLVDSGNDEN